MGVMRILLAALVFATQVQAQDLARPVPRPPAPAAWPADIPRAVVAVSQTAQGHTVLLRETCGWPGGAMRAYHAYQGHVTWACWGYNETGLMFEWSTGQQTTMAWRPFRTSTGKPLSYPALYTQLNPSK